MVERVCIGVGYTVAVLSDGSAGTAFTMRSEFGPSCGVTDLAGKIRGMAAADACMMAMSVNAAEAGVGVAVCNAVLGRRYDDDSAGSGTDAVEEMRIEPGDNVGMIGYFHPIINKFEERTDNLYIFERQSAMGALPDWSEDIYLPKCDAVVITGVTFINKTIDHILSLCKNAKEIVIMGASTMMCPEVLREYGVTVAAGSKVHSVDRLLEIVMEGGGGVHVPEAMTRLCERLNN
jgi:uncharacterized protein (DUF4213/DUF364 family)